MEEYGIVLVSHSKEIAQGLRNLLIEVASDVEITFVGGNEEGEIGTSFDQVSDAINQNTKDKLLAFYDLGSAKMNLELAIEMSDKEVEIFQVPIVEGAYIAAALLQAGSDIEVVKAQLEEVVINK